MGFYKYISFYKNNYFFIYDKNIFFNIHLVIPRYLNNIYGSKLFRLDNSGANTLLYPLRRRRNSIFRLSYIVFNRGAGKYKSNTRIF